MMKILFNTSFLVLLYTLLPTSKASALGISPQEDARLGPYDFGPSTLLIETAVFLGCCYIIYRLAFMFDLLLL